jgi:hypothetical protein
MQSANSTRAEERAEWEHERSEALLTNILSRASPAG